MDSHEETPKKDRGKSLAAPAAAGGGAGTILVTWANSLGDDNKWKPILLYIAPWISMVAGYLWVWGEEIVKRRMTEREIELATHQAIKDLDAALKDEAISDEAKKKFREEREKLRLLIVNKRLKDVAKALSRNS